MGDPTGKLNAVSSFFLEACGKTNKCIFKGITASESLKGTPWTLVPAPQPFPRPEDLVGWQAPGHFELLVSCGASLSLGLASAPVFLLPQVHAAPQELWPDRLVPGEKGECPFLAGSAGH